MTDLSCILSNLMDLIQVRRASIISIHIFRIQPIQILTQEECSCQIFLENYWGLFQWMPSKICIKIGELVALSYCQLGVPFERRYTSASASFEHNLSEKSEEKQNRYEDSYRWNVKATGSSTIDSNLWKKQKESRSIIAQLLRTLIQFIRGVFHSTFGTYSVPAQSPLDVCECVQRNKLVFYDYYCDYYFDVMIFGALRNEVIFYSTADWMMEVYVIKRQTLLLVFTSNSRKRTMSFTKLRILRTIGLLNCRSEYSIFHAVIMFSAH